MPSDLLLLEANRCCQVPRQQQTDRDSYWRLLVLEIFQPCLSCAWRHWHQSGWWFDRREPSYIAADLENLAELVQRCGVPERRVHEAIQSLRQREVRCHEGVLRSSCCKYTFSDSFAEVWIDTCHPRPCHLIWSCKLLSTLKLLSRSSWRACIHLCTCWTRSIRRPSTRKLLPSLRPTTLNCSRSWRLLWLTLKIIWKSSSVSYTQLFLTRWHPTLLTL